MRDRYKSRDLEQLKIYLAHKREYGFDPTPCHPSLLSRLVTKYGSLGNAVRECGEVFNLDTGPARVAFRRDRLLLAQQLVSWARQHGPVSIRALKRTNPVLAKALEKEFTRPESLAERLGLPIVPPGCTKWSDDMLLDAVRDYALSFPVAERNSMIRITHAKRLIPQLSKVARQRFGGWRAAVDSAGLDPGAIYERWTPQKAVEKLCEWSSKNGPLSVNALKQTDLRLLHVLYDQFGTLEKAAEAAGIELVRLRTAWTAESTIAGLKEWTERHDKLTVSRLETTDKPLYMACIRYFKSIRNAARRAGVKLDREPGNRKWSKDLILRELRKLECHGVCMTSSAVRKVNPRLVEAAWRYFASWNAAVAAAGVREAGPDWKDPKYLRRRLEQLGEKNRCKLTERFVQTFTPLLHRKLLEKYDSYEQALDALQVPQKLRSRAQGPPDWENPEYLRKRLVDKYNQKKKKKLTEGYIRKQTPALYRELVKRYGAFATALEALQIPRHMEGRRSVKDNGA